MRLYAEILCLKAKKFRISIDKTYNCEYDEKNWDFDMYVPSYFNHITQITW